MHILKVRQQNSLMVCFVLVLTQGGRRENDWLLYWWGIAHKCLSMGGEGAYYHRHIVALQL